MQRYFKAYGGREPQKVCDLVRGKYSGSRVGALDHRCYGIYRR